MFEILKTRKKTSIFGAILIIAVIYFFFFRKGAVTANTYVLGKVEKGTIVNSVSGSGQVVVSSQVDFKPQASGKIVSVNVKEGDKISAGTVIAEIDSTDAQRAVRDAKLNLDSAQVSLDKILKPADDVTIAQAQDAVSQAQRNLDQATKDRDQQNLTNDQGQKTAYDNGYNAVSSTYVDLSVMMDDLKDVKNAKSTSGDDLISSYGLLLGSDSKLIKQFQTDYDLAYSKYNDSLVLFKSVVRNSNPQDIYKLVSNTTDVTVAVSADLEDARNMLDAVVNSDGYKNLSIYGQAEPFKTTVIADIQKVNSHIVALQSVKVGMDSSDQNNPINQKKKEDAVTLAQETLKEKQSALSKLQEPADVLDVKSQKLVIEQRQNSLNDAESNYGDYFVTSPFDAVVAKTSVSVGDMVSSGTTVATLITTDMQAQVSLNEVDAASIKVGDKATMTFDAIPDLTITGKVYQIDTLGTVSQGVVTYNAKIVFDTPDDRVKPGMSVSADIITNVKDDALVIPNSALKTQGNNTYVEVLDPSLVSSTDLQTGRVTLITVPNQVNVEIGVSNDTQTEIVNGLNEGDQIITQVISSAAQSNASGASAVRIPGLGGGTGGGGANRGGGGFARGG